MNLTLDLAPERLGRLQRMAQRTGKPVETVLDELIDTLPEEKKTGADLAAELQREGLFAPYGNMTKTAQEVARELRQEAETRSSPDA